jgi:hypothetical protein
MRNNLLYIFYEHSYTHMKESFLLINVVNSGVPLINASKLCNREEFTQMKIMSISKLCDIQKEL